MLVMIFRLIEKDLSRTTGPQRCVVDVDNRAHGIWIVDLQQECLLVPTNGIERERSNPLALVVPKSIKIAGKTDPIQFALTDGDHFLRRFFSGFFPLIRV